MKKLQNDYSIAKIGADIAEEAKNKKATLCQMYPLVVPISILAHLFTGDCLEGIFPREIQRMNSLKNSFLK